MQEKMHKHLSEAGGSVEHMINVELVWNINRNQSTIINNYLSLGGLLCVFMNSTI